MQHPHTPLRDVTRPWPGARSWKAARGSPAGLKTPPNLGAGRPRPWGGGAGVRFGAGHTCIPFGSRRRQPFRWSCRGRVRRGVRAGFTHTRTNAPTHTTRLHTRTRIQTHTCTVGWFCSALTRCLPVPLSQADSTIGSTPMGAAAPLGHRRPAGGPRRGGGLWLDQGGQLAEGAGLHDPNGVHVPAGPLRGWERGDHWNALAPP